MQKIKFLPLLLIAYGIAPSRAGPVSREHKKKKKRKSRCNIHQMMSHSIHLMFCLHLMMRLTYLTRLSLLMPKRTEKMNFCENLKLPFPFPLLHILGSSFWISSHDHGGFELSPVLSECHLCDWSLEPSPYNTATREYTKKGKNNKKCLRWISPNLENSQWSKERSRRRLQYGWCSVFPVWVVELVMNATSCCETGQDKSSQCCSNQEVTPTCCV